jgi:hypothetical protein
LGDLGNILISTLEKTLKKRKSLHIISECKLFSFKKLNSRMKAFLILWIGLFLTLNLCAQNTLKGLVLDKETQKPLENVVLFISNTSYSAITDKNGNYTLSFLPRGNVQLIMRFVGFTTRNILLNIQPGIQVFNIELEKKPLSLPEFVIISPEKDGFLRWGPLFTALFLGTSANSQRCILKNPKVLEFRYYKSKGNLRVSADEPLIIRNNALGYEIQYSLEDFSYDFKTSIFHFDGYPLFIDLADSSSVRGRKWIENRKETYYGSLLHFMRSFYAHQLDREGFTVKRLIRVPNLKKLEAKKWFARNKMEKRIPLYLYIMNSDGNNHLATSIDSTKFYQSILNQKDSIDLKFSVQPDSLSFTLDPFTQGFFAKDSLEIGYTKKVYPQEYLKLFREKMEESYPISHFLFVHNIPVQVFRNGFYTSPYDLLIKGYLGWYVSISTILPFNYYPE